MLRTSRREPGGQHDANGGAAEVRAASGLQRSTNRIRRDFIALAADILVAIDFLTIATTGFLARLCWSAIKSGSWPAAKAEFAAVYAIVLCAAVIVPLVLRDRNVTTLLEFQDRARLVRRLASRAALSISILLALGFVTKTLDAVPRGWFAIWMLFAVLALLASRLVTARYLTRLEARGIVRDVVVIVGAGPAADRLIRHLHEQRGAGIEIAGVYDDRETRHEHVAAVPCGNVAALVELGKRRQIDWILLNMPLSAERRIQDLVRQLKAFATNVAVAPTWFGSRLISRTGLLADDIVVGLLAERPLGARSVVAKRASDLILGSLITLLALPLMAIIAALVAIDSPGPVLFRQRRHGWNNQEFDIYKFRTMSFNREASGPLRQTTRGDSRITRVGGFLRRMSLDELPQLLNVLRGDMSLVGPRPHAIDMTTQDLTCYEIVKEYAHRHRMKPGITGWAQVNGCRGPTLRAGQLRRRVELDLQYVENWSLGLDLRILWLTAFIVIGGRNAY